jgi:hypothetical protein
VLLQADSQESLDALTKGFGILGFTGLFDKETVVGVNCSPIAGANFACDNAPMCCEDNSFNVGAVFAFFFFLLTYISRALLPLAARIFLPSSNLPLFSAHRLLGSVQTLCVPYDENIIF